MKTFIGFIIAVSLLLAFLVYDSLQPGIFCKHTYDRSWNGLYLVKQKVCYTPILGMKKDPVEVARKPLFKEF